MASAAETACWSASLLSAGLLPPTLVALRLDRRRLGRDSVWTKPLKFEASLALHFATLALAVADLGEETRQSATLLWICWTGAAAAIVELACIGVQAGRASPSHFNTSTRLSAGIWAVMGLGAFLMTPPSFLIGLAVIADPAPALPPPLQVGWAVGLIGGTLLTVVVGVSMGARSSSHIGREAPGARRVPFFGWSLEVGDLRPAHFAATHLMQAAPAAALPAITFLPASAQMLGVVVACLGWSVITLCLWTRALAGYPISTLAS